MSWCLQVKLTGKDSNWHFREFVRFGSGKTANDACINYCWSVPSLDEAVQLFVGFAYADYEYAGRPCEYRLINADGQGEIIPLTTLGIGDNS